jgi:beta-lactam-binding protein with PASTA domain
MTRLTVPVFMVLFAASAAACSVMAGKGPGGLTVPKKAGPEIPIAGKVGAGRGGTFPMPDVTGMTRTEAEAALRAQGITGSITVDEEHRCDDPDVKATRVCYTAPRAGQSTTSTIPKVLYLRQKGTANYAMPDLRGKTVAEARQILRELGQVEQRVKIEQIEVLLDGCQPGRVCRQDPAPQAMTKESEYKELRIAPPADGS